jgi:hypothetical protein
MKQVTISGDADMVKDIVKKLDVHRFAVYLSLGDTHTTILTDDWGAVPEPSACDDCTKTDCIFIKDFNKPKECQFKETIKTPNPPL